MAKKRTASIAKEMVLIPNEAAPQAFNVALPVFTLVPRGKKKPRTQSYGGHKLTVSGSMAENGPPSFTLSRAKR